LNLLVSAGVRLFVSLEISFWIRQLYTFPDLFLLGVGRHGFLKFFLSSNFVGVGKNLFQANN